MASMEQKMGKAQGLTSRQKQLLEVVLQEPYIVNTFYLSGGTALSSWYLYHRESLDLDFFTSRSFDPDKISVWLKTNQDIIGYHQLHIDEDFGFLTVTFRYFDDTFLKVDFHHYTNQKLKKGIMWRGLEIDSIDDIAVNKLSTIASFARTRDYVDLYFILQKYPFSLYQLIAGVTKKFSQDIDPLQLTKNFLKVVEYTDFPKMLIRFKKQDMYNFYENLARSLKNKILI